VRRLDQLALHLGGQDGDGEQQLSCSTSNLMTQTKICRGHYELGLDALRGLRVAAAFTELAAAI
jgi:hypothetical protein